MPRIQRKDGTWVDVEMTWTVDENGAVTGIGRTEDGEVLWMKLSPEQVFRIQIYIAAERGGKILDENGEVMSVDGMFGIPN